MGYNFDPMTGEPIVKPDNEATVLADVQIPDTKTVMADIPMPESNQTVISDAPKPETNQTVMAEVNIPEENKTVMADVQSTEQNKPLFANLGASENNINNTAVPDSSFAEPYSQPAQEPAMDVVNDNMFYNNDPYEVKTTFAGDVNNSQTDMNNYGYQDNNYYNNQMSGQNYDQNGYGYDYNAQQNGNYQQYDQGNIEVKGKNPAGIVIAILAAVLVIVIGVVVVLWSGIFLSDKAKLQKALVSTMTVKTELSEVVKKAEKILASNEATFNYTVEAEDMFESEGALIINGKDKQIQADVDIEDVPSFSVLAGIDNTSVKAEVPAFCDYLFEYNYKEEKTGLIGDMAEREVEIIDAMCELVYETSLYNEDIKKKGMVCVAKHFNELDVEKEDPKKLKVDDKKVSCKGYSVVIDSDFVKDLITDLKDVYSDEMSTQIDIIEEVGEVSIDDAFDNISKELDDFPETTFVFYIYKGKVAGIHIEVEDEEEECDIYLRGKENRLYDISVEFDREEVMRFKYDNKKDSDKEIYSLNVEDEEIKLTYKYKKGLVLVEWDEDDSIEFNLTTKNDSVIASVDDDEIFAEILCDMLGLRWNSIESASGSIELTKGAKIKKYECKDTFDLNSADEDDFMDLIDEFDSSVTDLLGLY